MFKCDKCGCEHNSRTVCPKCGAPVVIVNEDYLLRRQQWEEQQKNNLRYKKREKIMLRGLSVFRINRHTRLRVEQVVRRLLIKTPAKLSQIKGGSHNS